MNKKPMFFHFRPSSLQSGSVKIRFVLCFLCTRSDPAWGMHSNTLPDDFSPSLQNTDSPFPSLFLAPWNNFRTICGLASHVVYRGCSLGCWKDSFSHTGVPQQFPSVFQCCYTGLDVIPTFTLMCGDVVGKLIADILGSWCQSLFPLSPLFPACV